MASLQIINRRIKSVRNTRQITKAMQLVAASKLRRAQLAATAPQAYVNAARELLERLGLAPTTAAHPLFTRRKAEKILYILVAGDRGMAGGYNANVVRALGKHIRDLPTMREISIIAIGKRAAQYAARAKDATEIASFDIDTQDASVIVLPVLEQATQRFERGEADEVYIVSTHFISTVSQKVDIHQLLPVALPEGGGARAETEMEPSAEELVDVAVRRILEAEVLQAVLEARASEQAARMLAMMNATDNASDIIDDLTLMFNNARQSSITQQISEISAGAEAIAKA
jgi:F-type H+-transporting ATPase subunit gamma